MSGIPNVWNQLPLFVAPSMRGKPLRAVRAYEERTRCEMWSTLQAAIARAWFGSVQHEWLMIALDSLTGENLASEHYQHAGAELKRRLATLKRHGQSLCAKEESDVREVAVCCLHYARALHALANAERNALRSV